MRKYIFFMVMTIVVLLLTTEAYAIKEFRFLGINHDDTPEQVGEKLTAQCKHKPIRLSDLNQFEWYGFTFLRFPDNDKYHSIYNKFQLGDGFGHLKRHQRMKIMENKTWRMKVYCNQEILKDNIISYWSCPVNEKSKLMLLTVKMRTDDEVFYRDIIKKFGEPSKTSRDVYGIWEGDYQTLYVYHRNGTVIVHYMYNNNIEEAYKIFKRKKVELKEQGEKGSEKLQQMF